ETCISLPPSAPRLNRDRQCVGLRPCGKEAKDVERDVRVDDPIEIEPERPVRHPADGQHLAALDLTASREPFHEPEVGANQAVVASSLTFQRTELPVNPSQLSSTENVLAEGLPMTTGPVLNQTPFGLSPPLSVRWYPPRRICRWL